MHIFFDIFIIPHNCERYNAFVKPFASFLPLQSYTHFLFCFQWRGDSGNRRNNMYYGTPFYGGYGYASPVPHPNMYAAAYGAYPMYGNQQLVS